MTQPDPYKTQAQERKARRVVAVVGSLARHVAGEMDGDYAFNVRCNTVTWIRMLTGAEGDDVQREAWEKLYQFSGINSSATGINPSVEVRATAVRLLRQDLEIDAAVQASLGREVRS